MNDSATMQKVRGWKEAVAAEHKNLPIAESLKLTNNNPLYLSAKTKRKIAKNKKSA